MRKKNEEKRSKRGDDRALKKKSKEEICTYEQYLFC